MKKICDLYFKKVDSSCAEILYNLLKEREHSIIHKRMPTYKEHKNFINSNPYLHWYVVFSKEIVLGSFYIKYDNSIGINVNNPSLIIMKNIINFIVKNFKPQKEIPSQIPSYFYINVGETNVKMKDVLTSIGLSPIQTSFKI